jgi:tRNA G18 (ribose-2'-O)-methylase SpoU
MPEFRIETLDDPRLDIYRSLRKTNQNRYQDLFIAEGVTVVERLFCSDFEVQSVLVTDQKMPAFRQKLSDDLTVYSLSKELATMLVGFTFHLGVLAAGYRRPAPPLISALPRSGASLVLIADQVVDQQNVGLLIRIASGFGADALLLTKGSADPFSRRAIRVSMGNGLFLPIIQLPMKGADALQELAGLGYSCCATVLSADAAELSSFQFPERTALIFGNETHGICDSMIAGCDQQLMISMLNGTDSLNVAIAAGIFGYAYRAMFPVESPA